ncbi:MAG: hypothetical protein AAF149_14190 [Bacteroidota bacterium]
MEEQQSSVMSVKDWVITLLISIIPFVGFVMLFVWGFGSGTNPNKANWAKAALVMFLIMIVLYFIFGAAFMGLFMAGMGGGY